MKNIAVILTLLFSYNASAQNFIEKTTATGKVDSVSFVSNFPEMLKSDLIFYGFVHGTEMTQHIDAKLLIELMQNGVKYYAPEVSLSGAYFLNKFLLTGEEKYLNFVLQSYAAPQDASIQWREKYRDMYNYNSTLEKENRLTIIGTDKEHSVKLKITHLAQLLTSSNYDNPILDSLSTFKSLEKDLHFMSGKHLFKIARKKNCSYKDILYTSTSQYHFAKRFVQYYEANTELVLSYFIGYEESVKKIMQADKEDRESVITNNFVSRVLPLIQNGEKVYSNYGYAHVLQESLNNKIYLAGRLKRSNPNLKIYSILTQLGDCNVLLGAKLCATSKVKRYGKTIQLAKVCGAHHSKEWDGDTKKEKLLGIDGLKKITPTEEITLLSISDLTKDQLQKRYFIDYVKGKNIDNVLIDNTKTTADYYQALIYVQGSKPNSPYQLPN